MLVEYFEVLITFSQTWCTWNPCLDFLFYISDKLKPKPGQRSKYWSGTIQSSKQIEVIQC